MEKGKNRLLFLVISVCYVMTLVLFHTQNLFPSKFYNLALISGLSFVMIQSLRKVKLNKKYIFLLIILGVIARLTTIPSDPIFENDYHRYMWDGKVMANGYNPYHYFPDDKNLDHLHTDYRDKIGWKEYKTIYPPFAQLMFAISHLITSDSLIGLKVMLTFFEVLTGIIILLWLKKKSVSLWWSSFYWLNPLLLKEFANSAHLDSILIFFTLLSLYLITFYIRKSTVAWVTLSFAFLTKFVPIVFVPFFCILDPKWKRNLSLFIAIILIFYIPFIVTGDDIFNGFMAYSKYWIFNAGIFKIVTASLNSITNLFFDVDSSDFLTKFVFRDIAAKITLGTIFIILYFKILTNFKKHKNLIASGLFIYALVLLFSPTVFGWYVTWIIPFAIIHRSKPWIYFSFLSLISYAWFFDKQNVLYYQSFEYFIFFILLWKYKDNWISLKTVAKEGPKDFVTGHNASF